MSREAAHQSQIEDEHDDLVMNIEFIFDILRNRMSNFEADANISNVEEVNNYARSLVDDTQELIDFLKESE